MNHPVPVAALLILATLSGDREWSREWVVEGAPVTKRIAFVIDASGSMAGEPYRQASREILTIMSLFPDDGYVRVYAFSDGVSEFPGGWRPLPDAELVDRVAAWLAERATAGNTDLARGVVAALKNESPDLSVIVVTDGDATGDGHLERIEAAQKDRAAPAPVHVIGAAETWSATGRAMCEGLAKQNGGGLVVLSVRSERD